MPRVLTFAQNKLEAQYAAKRDAHASEVQDLKQQLELKGNEIRTLNATIDSLKSVNEELKVRKVLLLVLALVLKKDSEGIRRNVSRYRGW